MTRSTARKMGPAAERVFGIPELLDQIFEDVNFTDLFILQRVNKTVRQHVLKTPRLQQRLSSRLPDPKTEADESGEVHVDLNTLFASRSCLSFLFLEPFVFQHCSVVTRPWEKCPILELEYSYTPRSAPASILSPSDRMYHDHGTIAMRRGYQFFAVSPSWAKVWLPNAPVRVCIKIYRDEHQYAFTEATMLDSDKAEMQSLAIALHELASGHERKWPHPGDELADMFALKMAVR